MRWVKSCREGSEGNGRTSSGGYVACTRASTSSFAASVTVPSSSVDPGRMRMSEPRLEVRIKVVFWKLMWRPCESVS